MRKPFARVVELDIIRAAAIIIILFGHSYSYLPTVTLNSVVAFFTSFAYVLFFFISGYVLYLNHPSFRQLNEVTDFFKKRVLRIFPLYWLVLALWFLLGVPFASRLDALVIIFGLQGFLSPMYSSVLATGWWFIGVILVLYTIYPLVTALGSDAVRLPAPLESDVTRFALMLVVPLLILVVLRLALFIIADSVFEFYIIFVLGVAISKYDILGKYGFLTENRKKLLKYSTVVTVSFAAVLASYALLFSANLSVVTRFADYGLFPLKNVLYLLFALLAFCLARLFVVSYSKASRPLSYAVLHRGLLLIGFSSYAIYLFFMPILTEFMYALLRTQLTALQIDIIQIFIGFPIVIVVAYLLQSTQNEVLKRVRKHRTASALSSDST